MGVLLQAFFKIPPDDAVPSPADGDSSVPWWWDHLAAQANSLRQAGFTAVWLPPMLKTSDGAQIGADGYGPFDDYDVGSKNQKGSIPIRFGTREQLQRCVAIMRSNGLDVYLDMVEHQRIGDTTPFVFRYPGADGTPNIGRFRKDPTNFVPQVQRDPNLGGPVVDDLPFGRELAPINARPSGYVFKNLIAAATWLTQALDIQGYRIDDVKGLSTDFLLPFLNSPALAGKFAVGEFFDGNRVLVNGWIFNPKGMQGRPSAFDFPLKFVLSAMCNNAGQFNMGDLDHAGLTGISPLNSVTFVENHDTDLQTAQKIVFNKLLGYAYILTSEGYPCVYYRDYSTDKNCFGLKPQIDNLIWIHENLAQGPTQQRWKDFDVFAFERLGGTHLLVGLNNDPGAAHTITVATDFGPNVTLHDYSGHGPNVVTGGGGSVTLTIPPNNNGLSYVCYSRDGQGGPIVVNSLPVTQTFEGAADLDILPAIAGKPVAVCRIWCAADTSIQATLKPDTSGWTAATAIKLDVIAPDGTNAATQTITHNSSPTALAAVATNDGFHQLQLTATNTPPTNTNPPYLLTVKYTATQTLDSATGPQIKGQWSDLIPLSNVPIHAHLLPNGKMLYWGRRDVPGSQTFSTLNQHFCLPFIWDPVTRKDQRTQTQPALADGTQVNLFCSGHTLLADGRVMVVGGHLFDSQGVNQACVYDWQTDSWTALPLMNNGRWYPTAVTLPDSSVFVCSGSMPIGPLQPPVNLNTTNNISQVWNGSAWNDVQDFNQNNRGSLPLFPRLHVAPDGRVFMTGQLADGFFLDPGSGTWGIGPSRSGSQLDYAPSVMYDTGKIIYIGGGVPPVADVEIIDLNVPGAQWNSTASMNFSRRQHNATILPDGTVLVTGGTRGNGFNVLDPGQPIHVAELWDPVSQKWQQMASEAKDRCYHSVAVLLPDGRVFSGGGGEYAPTLNVTNPTEDTHTDAQMFSPPYLFKGPRPIITSAPTNVVYGQQFEVGVANPTQISAISWIRLASVTHSFDQNQRLNFLSFTPTSGKLNVTAPANANISPPGHYMLFVLDKNRIPSIARIIQITAVVAQQRAKPALRLGVINLTPAAKAQALAQNAKWPPVIVGITPTCIYGLAGCWGGAHEALQKLSGVEAVPQIVNPIDSTVEVYLSANILPDVDLWRQQFTEIVKDAYGFRGVEATLTGTLQHMNGTVRLIQSGTNAAVAISRLQASDKIQWNLATRSLWPITPSEQTAFDRLMAKSAASSGALMVKVTGPLTQSDAGFQLEVRDFT